MSPPEHERSRPTGRSFATAAAAGFARFRWRFFRLSPNVRFALLCALVVGSGILAAFVGWPLLPTTALVALGLLVFVFSMAHPRGAATAAVLAAWLLALPIMGKAYDGGALMGSSALAGAEIVGADTREVAALALLGILTAFAAQLIKAFPPWQTALLALTAAGVLGSLVALVVPAAGVIPAYVVGAAVFGYRAVAARRGVRAPARTHDASRQDSTAATTAPVRAGQESCEDLSVAQALAELEDMIGLDPVKRQIRSIAASIEAARMRAEAGYAMDKPMRHFVFVGPPGTGKTSVGRAVARIFFAFGLLDRPRVVEAQRADLVGEYLGATALKTNQLVDSALGGVLFIDEAYGLVNQGEGQGDKFGAEAVQTLLKRAEDDRHDVVIILAGYEREMDDFLAANPGLNSRFGTRVRFPTYSPAELLQIAEHHVASRGERLHPDAVPELRRLLEGVRRRGIVDELGNGRFVRSLVEAAAAARDVCVVERHGPSGEPSTEELVTVLPRDIEEGYAEVTTRFRGYADTPTVDEALGELDGMVGLAPVKRQVRSIAAGLQVGRVRRERRDAGVSAAPPMRHFVFTGPPGTGKTTVARTLGRIFAALGLLSRPDVVEASRVDLVGEHLGQTAIKTNKLVDKALGGVLFIDEAYSLDNEGYAGGDAFGSEAIATLLKRAEDDRDKVVIILAGYAEDMERLLARNQGLASRFTTRVPFPSYTPEELREIAVGQAQTAGDHWDPGALAVLQEALAGLGQEEIAKLGNGRFARSLYEEAAAARDLRLAERGDEVTTAELTALTSADVRAAYADLTERFSA